MINLNQCWIIISDGIPTSRATYQEKKLRDSKSQSTVTSSTSDGEQLQAGIERLQLGRSIEVIAVSLNTVLLYEYERVPLCAKVASLLIKGKLLDSVEKKHLDSGRTTSKEILGQSTSGVVPNASSGRSSPSSLTSSKLTNLDSINLSLKLEPNQKKKKFTPDSFNNGSKMEVKPSDNDPLSQLDPLWSIKK